MLRILAGTLLSGTLLSGPASASSILVPPPMEAAAGPSVLVIDEAREITPIDPTVTSAYEDGQEPAVIEAPRYVPISRSISAMLPTGEPASSGIAATGEGAAEEGGVRPQRQARQIAPMVIRGGLVGEAFPAPRAASPTPSAPSRAQQPAGQDAPSAAPDKASGSGGSQPSHWQDTPADAPSAVPM